MLSVWAMCRADARVSLAWSDGFALPSAEGRSHPGVARPFCGEHDGMVLLAGGANFPDTPLADGGKKRYHATVFGLPVGQRTWRAVGTLPEPAKGADRGNGRNVGRGR